MFNRGAGIGPDAPVFCGEIMSINQEERESKLISMVDDLSEILSRFSNYGYDRCSHHEIDDKIEEARLLLQELRA